MKIGTALFTWHRSEHTRKVLDALARNSILPEHLYIFQDGMSEKADPAEWKRVNQLIRNVDFCDTKLIVSDSNKGCKKSIVSGINYVLEECDAVIVLEDDCVPTKQYMRFMVSALETYNGSDDVYSISGWAWDIALRENKADAYFNGRSCSSGWGTWKDKWAIYEENYYIVNEIKKDPIAKERLNIWGNDLEEMLAGNIHGTCDAWDVFWSLSIIKKGGYCLSPYKTLIHNIGFDGSGLHCGINNYFQDMQDVQETEDKKEFVFPKEVIATEECKKEFMFIFGGKTRAEKYGFYTKFFTDWICMLQEGRNITIPNELRGDIAFWGKGKIVDMLQLELSKHNINAYYIIETRPSEIEYKGIPIVTIDKIPNNIKNVIVIPYFDIEIIKPHVTKIRSDINLYGINEFIM